MDKIAEVKQVVRHENWKRMYEEYQRSGMKVNDWCVMQGLSVKTFYYRLKVIREEILNECLLFPPKNLKMRINSRVSG